ncbi:alginate lyase family protein [Arthrobacter sp. ISL-30]|uniref:alginate lyase family protein n=1 Tax=Arthrobacter sp. ISL-30 TaxID=2819109 RepID=UPI001BECC655|nr:alginate lyase family protein [Arthrobacter sp. ISL-30]MBT2512329.1 alginate lyase family protein [Arthrobacter sp. ISL-30]
MNPVNPDLGRRALLQAAGLGTVVGVVHTAQARAAQATPWAGGPVDHAYVMTDATMPGPAFAHPGILHRAEDLERMRRAVAGKEQPIYDGYLAMAANARSSYSYKVQNTGQVTSWGRGPSNFPGQAAGDAAAAYQNALMWAVTGDKRHADKSRDILNAWTRSLTAITGADGQLGSGLQGFKFANAAELLRHSGYDGWPEEDFQACVRSLRTVWYESLSGYALFANGNWDDAALQTILAVAVLSDDRVMFENGLRWAAFGSGNGSVLNRVVNDSGQGQESGRDQPHEQLGQGLLGYCAQVAWNQGVDLFALAGRRILAGYEYNARYNLGYDDVPFVADLDRTGKYLKTAISPRGRGEFRPIYELAYSHYVSRLGLSAPNTQAAVFRGVDGSRIIEGWHEDDPGWGTLTYARPAAGGSTPSSVPGGPGGLRAVGAEGRITLTWIGAVEPSSGAPARSYTVKRSEAGGDYSVIAADVTANEFIDVAVRPGRTYFYMVTAVNETGMGPDSAAVAGMIGLPTGWASMDIGSASPAGSTTFDGEHFVVEDLGSDIAGAADDFRFTYTRLKSDGVITARIGHPISSQYAKIGVMVRSSLDAGSPHAAMLIQGLPLHTWSGVWTTRNTTGAPTSGTGSTPVPPTQKECITVKAGFPITEHGSLPDSATPLRAPYVEAAGDGYRLRMPYWVRLTRRGSTLTGAISPDGREWTDVGSTEIDLGGEVYAGLASCSCLGATKSGSTTESGTATFDNVTVGGWSVAKPAGTASGLTAAAGVGAIQLAWADPDPAARYTVKRGLQPLGPHQTIASDVGPVGFGVRIRYADPTGTPGRQYYYSVAKTNTAGEGPASVEVSAVMPAQVNPVLQGSPAAFGNVGLAFSHRIQATPDPASYWVRNLPPGLLLDDRTGVISGIPRQAGAFDVTVGAGRSSAALKIAIGVAPAAPWSYSDFGDYVLDERQLGAYGVAALRTAGSASADGSRLIVRGAGSGLDVNGQGMVGHVLYQPVTGDHTIIAQITSRENAGSAARVGVIMCKSLSPFDLMAASVLSASSAQFSRRLAVAGRATSIGSGSGTWVRLNRTGSTFAAAVSSDGSTWTTTGEQVIADFGAAPYYIGLVVYSGDSSTLTTATFDDVAIS